MCKNNEKNDKFDRKVAFLMYTEMANFRPQSWKVASKLKLKLKPHRGLQSCAKIIEKTVKNGLLSLATSNLKLF